MKQGIFFLTLLIILSSLVSGKCETSLKCLEFGAFDVISKPKLDITNKMPLLINELYLKIKAANSAKIDNLIFSKSIYDEKKIVGLSNITATEKVITIGSSTGGTKALEKILLRLPSNMPPIIISQHMPAGFTFSFAQRLNSLCPQLEINEAVNDTILKNGTVHIAPGDFHLLLSNYGSKYKIFTKQVPKICCHRPSVDIMFSSVAKTAGKNAIGIILTGMGAEGAKGLLEMFKQGALTIAQDEKSSVVFGMLREAISAGAAKYVVSLDLIPEKIVQILR